MSSGVVVAGAVAFAVLFLFVVLPLVYVRNYIKVPPNEVGVFTGLGKTPTVVRGGAKFRVPGLVRVDMMSLEPVPVDIKLRGSLSSERVPINVDAVGMIRYGASDEMLQTAVQRFLTSDPDSLKQQINEILSGSMRGIVAKMTPEEINSDREKLRENVIDDAGGSLAKIGMEVDVLTVAGISDDVGYLSALGEKRTAEVKRDASIAKAEAERDSKIKSAQAKQAGDVAQAQADTAIASANEERDKELAAIKAAVDAENAKASQAGPLAEAQAKKAVVIAEQEAEAAREQARVQVEQQRAERAKEALVADVIAPADAQQQATVTRAQGERQARILQAQADAEAARQDGAAQADARKLAADRSAPNSRPKPMACWPSCTPRPRANASSPKRSTSLANVPCI